MSSTIDGIPILHFSCGSSVVNSRTQSDVKQKERGLRILWKDERWQKQCVTEEINEKVFHLFEPYAASHHTFIDFDLVSLHITHLSILTSRRFTPHTWP